MNHRSVALTLGLSLTFAACLVRPSSSFAASPSATTTMPDPCSLKQLSITVAAGSAAGGSEGMLVAFRNRGATICYLQGYPKVVAIRPGASSDAITVTSTYLGGLGPYLTPSLISLKPGSTASVVVAAADHPRIGSSPCERQRYKTVTVSLPGQSGSKRLSADLPREATSLPSCSRIAVTPFQKGAAWF